jgi:cytochrome c
LAQAAHGKQVFEAHCTMCHAGGQGPSLTGVAGRKAASVRGYAYSAALKASQLTWTPANLDAFLAAPGKRVPGTSMMIGLPQPADRAAVIAYLATLKR